MRHFTDKAIDRHKFKLNSRSPKEGIKGIKIGRNEVKIELNGVNMEVNGIMMWINIGIWFLS